MSKWNNYNKKSSGYHDTNDLYENDEEIEFPFSRLHSDDEYHYFDLNYICRNMHPTRKVCSEGHRLSRNGTVKMTKLDVGYTSSYYSLEPVMNVLGTVNTDGKLQRISLSLKKESMISFSCCPGCYSKNYMTYYGNGSMCVHIWALLYLVEDYIIRYNPGDATEESTMRMFQNYRKNRVRSLRSSQAKEQDILHLEPRLEYFNGNMKVSFRVGTDKLYVVKDLTEFVRQMDRGDTAKFGKSTLIDYAKCSPDEKSAVYFNFIKEAVNEERGRSNLLIESRYGTSIADTLLIRGNIPMIGARMDEFYDIICGDTIEYTDKGGGTASEKMTVSCRNARPELELTVRASKDSRQNFDGVSVSGHMSPLIEGVRGCYYVSPDGYLNKSDINEIQELLPIYRVCDTSGDVSFHVGRRYLSEFYYTVLPLLKEYGTVNEPDSDVIDGYLAPEVVFKFYLDADDENITCRALGVYGDKTVQIIDVFDNEKWKTRQAWRDMSREDEAVDTILNYFPAIDDTQKLFHCNRDTDAIYRVLSEGVGEMMSLGEVHCTESFKRLKIRPVPRISVGVSVESSVMDLSISSDDISREELLEALESYHRKKKYFRLKNGDFMKIDEPCMEALSDMMDSMHITPKKFVQGKMKIPSYRALYLEKMLEEENGIYAKRDSHFRQLVKDFKTIEDSDYEVPESLAGTLRSYQVTGYKWIRTLAAFGFGGILADDMGLGKTIQMISAFTAWKGASGSNKEDYDKPCLVICPASLTYNWIEEMERFAPELHTGIIVGSQNERKEIIEHCSDYDVLVTSYDLLKRDIDQYEDHIFLCEVLDEAQFIKNYTTAAAKSVKLIKSRYRFALTGTPIENRLSELWSIFDYLMPGFLYEYSVFKREFETPIVKNRNDEVSARLRRMISPFIMRRLKKDVLKDLPDKIEKVQYATFEAPQQKLYDAQVAHMKKMLISEDDEEFTKDRIRVLAELTRIRQICCDPSLIYEDYDGGSAKRQACLELIHQAIEGDHQMLIFSQFTSMLSLLEDDLKSEGIKYYKITGETPKKDRLDMVHAFNKDGTPVFLISLKAGGTGLNLTGADIVIHYDPWWNTAVQNQATDRTHRIGQTHVVSVYRLIVKDSIEEKILKMQDDKKDLADEILSGENQGLGNMSREELMELLGV